MNLYNAEGLDQLEPVPFEKFVADVFGVERTDIYRSGIGAPTAVRAALPVDVDAVS